MNRSQHLQPFVVMANNQMVQEFLGFFYFVFFVLFCFVFQFFFCFVQYKALEISIQFMVIHQEENNALLGPLFRGMVYPI